jgi:hypothetical protein
MDLDITPKNTSFIWAQTSSDLATFHGYLTQNLGVQVGSINIDLSTGGNNDPPPNPKWGGEWDWHKHGQAILWTIVCDTLIIVGRHMKKQNKYFDIHAWGFFLLAVASIINVRVFSPLRGSRRMLVTAGANDDFMIWF